MSIFNFLNFFLVLSSVANEPTPLKGMEMTLRKHEIHQCYVLTDYQNGACTSLSKNVSSLPWTSMCKSYMPQEQ